MRVTMEQRTEMENELRRILGIDNGRDLSADIVFEGKMRGILIEVLDMNFTDVRAEYNEFTRRSRRMMSELGLGNRSNARKQHKYHMPLSKYRLYRIDAKADIDRAQEEFLTRMSKEVIEDENTTERVETIID